MFELKPGLARHLRFQIHSDEWQQMLCLDDRDERIEFIESEKQVGKGEGGTNEDDEYFDELPNI